MRPKYAIRAFVLLGIILASNIGCIGLVPAREFMEDAREEPEVKDVIEKIKLNHTFVSAFPDISSTVYTHQERFSVDENVNEVKVYIGVAIAGPDDLFPDLGADYRFVEATLTDANGDVVWSQKCQKTCNPAVSTFQEPLAIGTWTMTIDARGYGEDLVNTYKDSFELYVHLFKECTEYPTEGKCSFD